MTTKQGTHRATVTAIWLILGGLGFIAVMNGLYNINYDGAFRIMSVIGFLSIALGVVLLIVRLVVWAVRRD